ncbi:MAG: hypothetical protein AAFO06_15385 [Cyanobacteria bacterium J06597_16]
MAALSKQILKTVEVLSENEQRQLLDYAEFLKFKRQQREVVNNASAEPKSFLEVARDVIGMAEGPGDLISNSDYMNGYGQ